HSESPEALFAHTAGLRIVSPATAGDAYTLIQHAIASPDPVIFLEPKSRYWDKDDVATSASDAALGIEAGDGGRVGLTADAEIAFGQARLLRPVTDVTVVGYGPSVKPALAAAEVAE